MPQALVHVPPDRDTPVKRGKRLEYFTIAFTALEAVTGIGAGLIAGSISLSGFGSDSLSEVTSALALLCRTTPDPDKAHRQRAETQALRIVRVCFLALAAYLGYDSARSLSTGPPSGACSASE